ncbi:hypothetical protein [Streptomyces sp. 1114.5]|uniref:hypothetical protein n=1 Tax=Streptomyces sp. 1114.5 TaxID=1938830 RepID=UPI0016008FE2|nr:hypothetical protein [Streptomyces sp. 1114.5]
MPCRPTGWTLALGIALPVEAATALALPAVLAGAVDAALSRRSGPGALLLLALLLGAAAAAHATAAAAGPACSAEATAALRGRLVRHLLALGPGGRLRGGPLPATSPPGCWARPATRAGGCPPSWAPPPRCSPRSARSSGSGCSRRGWRSPSSRAWCPVWC